MPASAEAFLDEQLGATQAAPDAVDYETRLTPKEEQQFQKWKQNFAPKDSGSDYDFRGAFKAGLTPSENGHWPDTYKKPNHPTFSDQSIYAKDRPDLAGNWEGEKYIKPSGVSAEDFVNAQLPKVPAAGWTDEVKAGWDRFSQQVQTPVPALISKSFQIPEMQDITEGDREDFQNFIAQVGLPPAWGDAPIEAIPAIHNKLLKPLVDFALSPVGLATGLVGKGSAALKGVVQSLFFAITAKSGAEDIVQKLKAPYNPNASKQEQANQTLETLRDIALPAMIASYSPVEEAPKLDKPSTPFTDYEKELDYLQSSASRSRARIKSAAVKTPEGKILEGSEHDAIAPSGAGKDGFTTNAEEFVDRKEGMEIAKEAGQVPPDTKETELHSGMLEPKSVAQVRMDTFKESTYKIQLTEMSDEKLNQQLEDWKNSPDDDRQQHALELVNEELKRRAERVDVDDTEGIADAAEKQNMGPTYGIAAQPDKEQPFITGIKNAQVDAERVARGSPPLMSEAKRGFGEVWDTAMKQLDQRPAMADELVSELNAHPRPVTDVEDAILLRQRIVARTEFEKAVGAVNEAAASGDEGEKAEARLRFAQTSDLMQRNDTAERGAGTETARGLAARKLMADEDFSLASLAAEKMAANDGKQLTPEQMADVQKTHAAYQSADARLKAYKTRTANRIKELQSKLASGDLEVKQRARLQLDEEATKLQADLERVKQDWKAALEKDRLAKREPWQKALDWFVKWERNFKLSYPTVLGKLFSAALTRGITTTAEEAVGAGLSRIPGLAKVAAMAPREGGFSADAIAGFFTEAYEKAGKDAWTKLTTGTTDIEMVYGRKMIDRDFSNFIGNIHGAMKAPVVRAEFTLALRKRSAWEFKHGTDLTDPAVQMRLGVESLNDAYRSIFMQRGFSSDMFNQLVHSMEMSKKYPVTGEVSARLARFLMPIVRVPPNIIHETTEGAIGVPMGAIRLVRAMQAGLDNVKPEEADAIMRNFKKGSIGLGLMALGYFNHGNVGGFDWREKRQPGSVKTGGFRLMGVDVPMWFVHAPAYLLMEIGSTVYRVSHQHMKGEELGVSEGMMAAGLGLVEQTPFIGQMLRVDKLFGTVAERHQYLGELAKSTVLPGVLIKVAEWTDNAPKGTKRKPTGILQNIESGIPGLRENVPLVRAKE